MDAFALPHLSPTTYLTQPDRWRLIDVRRHAAVVASGMQLAGAEWYDPVTLTLSHPLFRADRPLAVTCVHGHEVSAYVTAMALVAGAEAAQIIGGFEALRAAGAPQERLA